MKKFISLVCGIYLSWGSFAVAQEGLAAKVADSIVQSTFTNYTSMVVEKLQQDGTGASADYSSQEGFVMPPEAFMRRVAIDAITKQKQSGEKSFTLTFAPGGSGFLTVKLKAQSLSADQQALIAAKVADSIIRSIRATYTSSVVRKLQLDRNTGASIDYAAQKGFVPLPAVFARQVALDAASKSDNKQLALSLRSLWNLNEQQGLQDDFEREGWEFLAKQQKEQLASRRSLRKFAWKPFSKVVTVNGKKTLRYFSADPAIHKSCVGCHNQWEGKEEIKAMRASQGGEVGKVFKKDELMGALSIAIPVAE